MLMQDLTQHVKIWPIKMRVEHRSGYTLWASIDDNDLVLSILDNVLLFRSEKKLFGFIRAGNTCNFSDHKGYKELSSLLKENTQVSMELMHSLAYYNFDRIGRLLSEGQWATWRLKTCSQILDSLNMLSDIGVTVDDEWIKSQIGTSSSQIGAFMDTLTFVTRQDLQILSRFDFEHISRVYSQILQRVMQKVLFVC